MECSCEINMDSSDDVADFYASKMVKARKKHHCCECHREILPGEQYELITGCWDDRFERHKTCTDCLSLRNQFFKNGWYFERMWDDFYENIGCTANESCIAALTPKARENVCDHIERCWMDGNE